MTLISLCSVRGSPGCTTTALLVAGCLGDGVVVEADLAGGVLPIRYGLGREPGLTTLAAEGTIDPHGWRRHAQVAGGVPVLVGPDDPRRAAALWDHAGGRITDAVAGAAGTAVADVGRLPTGDEVHPLVRASDLVAVVARPRADELVGLAQRLPGLRGVAETVVVLVGDGYRPTEVATHLGVDVAATLPVDHRAAAMLDGRGGSPAALRRTLLARTARTLAEGILLRTAGPLAHGGLVRPPTDEVLR